MRAGRHATRTPVHTLTGVGLKRSPMVGVRAGPRSLFPTGRSAMNRMSHNRIGAIAAAAVVVLVIGWAVFRPELLFVDARADESLPASAAPAASSSPAAPAATPAAVLARGEF